MDSPINLNAIAKATAEMTLLTAFSINNKFPIKNWNYKIEDECLKNLEKIEDRELADYAIENVDELEKLIQAAMERKLCYLLTEGFTYKKRGYYVFYTEKEIKSQVQHILDDDKDSV